MMIIEYIALFWIIFFVTTYITWYLYMNEYIKIPYWSYFDRYPFICYKCMTTWLLIAVYIMVGFLLNNFIFAGFGVILSGLHGYGMYKLDKERLK